MRDYRIILFLVVISMVIDDVDARTYWNFRLPIIGMSITILIIAGFIVCCRVCLRKRQKPQIFSQPLAVPYTGHTNNYPASPQGQVFLPQNTHPIIPQWQHVHQAPQISNPDPRIQGQTQLPSPYPEITFYSVPTPSAQTQSPPPYTEAIFYSVPTASAPPSMATKDDLPPPYSGNGQ